VSGFGEENSPGAEDFVDGIALWMKPRYYKKIKAESAEVVSCKEADGVD
jgi:hypothetical protein